MTTFITTSIDLPANLDDLRALVESVDHLTGAALVESGHEQIKIVHTDDYTMDDIEGSKSTSAGDHLHFSGFVSGMTEEEFAEEIERKRFLRKLFEDFNNDDFD